MIDWRPSARALASTLVASGTVRTPAWHAAFENTPRHVFVPQWYDTENGRNVLVRADDPVQRDRWWSAIYADTVLVTQVLSPPSASGEDTAHLPTSSSTMPGIMAWMLEALDVHDGQRVLEIGTGTGYNTALLCQRLGPAHVVSVDIDPGLVEQARERLASLEFAPTLIVGDGAENPVDSGPFDRIISTAAVDHIPPVWIEQLTLGGLIVTDLRGSMTGAISILRKTADDLVEGVFDPFDAAFMPLRPRSGTPLQRGSTPGVLMDTRNPHTSTTDIDPTCVLDNRDFRFLLQLHLAGIDIDFFSTGDEVVGLARDGAWVKTRTTPLPDGRHHVEQGGPRRVWDTVDSAYALWRLTHNPTIDRFGTTATTDRTRQRVWLDEPHSHHKWPLPL
ncbi:MAG: methyltransferase domain-containing protein [Sciscionella sp.]